MPPDSPPISPSGNPDAQRGDESMQSRYRGYRESDRLDEAWCLSAALVSRGEADAEQRQLYEEHRKPGIVRAKERLSDELWHDSVLHADEQGQARAGRGSSTLRPFRLA